MDGKHSLVYRARTIIEKQPVIFKTINSAYPTPEEIAGLKREYAITTHCQNEGVIRALERGKYSE